MIEGRQLSSSSCGTLDALPPFPKEHNRRGNVNRRISAGNYADEKRERRGAQDGPTQGQQCDEYRQRRTGGQNSSGQGLVDRTVHNGFKRFTPPLGGVFTNSV